MGAVISAIDLATFMSIWHTDLGLTKEDILSNLVQYPDSKGLSALHLACIKGHADAVDVLMKLGANPFAVVSGPARGCWRRQLVLTWQWAPRAHSKQSKVMWSCQQPGVAAVAGYMAHTSLSKAEATLHVVQASKCSPSDCPCVCCPAGLCWAHPTALCSQLGLC